MGDAGDIAEKPTGDARRFAAFISYSHADAAAAAKLQRKLERYRLPKRIAETRASDATALGPIFRDREDLAAAASLSDAIREAIARADALVVMCSPDAASSPWVAAEIELFRELHPQKPILAALLSGEPAIAFPPALTVNGNEPLAADLRPKGDGAQLGFLKIVAGIAGVPLDSLIQRDAQRRIRRVTAITGGALAAMLIMGVMTTLALQARNEAAQQRAAAEGLVEYMLTDLREKLRGVGRLDVMDAVNERAMKHYRRQGALADLPADSLERRARILHAMGEDYQKQGELDKASAKFQEAHLATSNLLARRPDDGGTLFAHAQSESWLGRIAELREDKRTAKHHYQRYLILAKKLGDVADNRKVALLERGHANLNLGIVEMAGQPDVGKARDYFSTARSDYENAARLGSETNEHIYFRANAAAWLADTYFAEQNYRASLGYREEELSLNQQARSKDVGNANATYLVAKTRLALAKNLMKLGDFARAKIVLIDAKAQMADLTRLDRTNDEWGYQHFRIVSNLAIVGKTNASPKIVAENVTAAEQIGSEYRSQQSPIYPKIRKGLEAMYTALALHNNIH